MRNLYNLCKARYRLDDCAGNTVVQDNMGFSNGVSTRNTNLTTIPGVIGKAFKCNGSTDYIDTNNNFTNTFRNSYTLNIWCETDNSNFSLEPMIIGIDANKQILIYLRADGTLYFVFGGYGNGPEDPVFGATREKKMLTFIGTQIDATHYKVDIYVNAQWISSSGSIVHSYADFTPTSNLLLGGYEYQETMYADYNGSFDDFTIFEAALTAEEITWLYNNGNGRKDLKMIKVFIGKTADHLGDWQYDDSANAYTASNWINADTGAKCAKPGANDIVIFDSRSSSVTDGMSRAETGGINLALLHARSGFAGDIGSSSEYLNIKADMIIFEGKGKMYLKAAAANVTTDSLISNLIVRNSTASVYLASDVNSASYSSVFAKVQCIRGLITAANATIITDLIVYGDSNITIGTGCVNVKASSLPTNFQFNSGTITSGSVVGTIIQNGGTFAGNQTIENIEIYGGNFNFTPATGAIVKKGKFAGGTFKVIGTENVQFGSDANIQFYILDGSTVDLSVFEGQVNYSSGSELLIIGGLLKARSGSELTI